MGRTRAFDPSRALHEALMVFWEHGYENTSIDDIVEATGASRHGLYSTFGDKRQLYLRALELYGGLLRASMWGPLYEPDASLPELRRFLQLQLDVDARVRVRGCFLCNTAAQMAPSDERAAKLVERFYREMAQALTKALERAVAIGELDEAFDVTAFADNTVATLVGVSIMGRTAAGRRRAKAALESLSQALS